MTQEHEQAPSPKPSKARSTTSKTAAKPRAKKSKHASPRWVTITRRVLTYAGIPLLFLVCLYVGLYIGYVKLGEQPASEIWDWSTWRHMYDLVFAEG